MSCLSKDLVYLHPIMKIKYYHVTFHSTLCFHSGKSIHRIRFPQPQFWNHYATQTVFSSTLNPSEIRTRPPLTPAPQSTLPLVLAPGISSGLPGAKAAELHWYGVTCAATTCGRLVRIASAVLLPSNLLLYCMVPMQTTAWPV